MKSYYETVNRGEMLSLDRQFKASDSAFAHAFSLVGRPFNEDYFSAAKNSLNLGDDNRTVSYLQHAIRLGLELKRIKKDIAFNRFKKSRVSKGIAAPSFSQNRA